MHNHHFYLVFNPMINNQIELDKTYKTQAHEFYAQLKMMVTGQQVSDPFLYWGKLKVSQHSSTEINQYSQIIQRNKVNGFDTHLYISDFHHFWVAKVESVHAEIYNRSRTLSFYDDKEVEIWFKITDMDLISAEFEETLFYLSQLYVQNEYSSKKIDSINPYLGDLKFPMIVQDRLQERYFQNLHMEDPLRLIRNNPLVDQSLQSANMSTHMQSFVLSPQVFAKLPHSAKKELLSAELNLTKDLFASPAIMYQTIESYFRILESVVDLTVGEILKEQFGDLLYLKKDGSEFTYQKDQDSILLHKYSGHMSLSAIVKLYQNHKNWGNIDLEKMMQISPEGMEYFTACVLPFIQEFEILPKIAALVSGEYFAITKQDLIKVRNQILGVGCLGVINSLISMLFRYEEIKYLQKAS